MKVDSPTEVGMHALAETDSLVPTSKRARLTKTSDDGQIDCHRALEEVEFASMWFHSLLRQ